MKLEEGQIYRGGVSVSGEAGPEREWIIVAPFGKTHAHSIDNPLELHCLPVAAVLKGVENGMLRLVGEDGDHPVLRLQRAKETQGVRDAHLGLYGARMDKMLALLDDAVKSGRDYAPYAAGEVMALINPAMYRYEDMTRIIQRVHDLVHLIGLKRLQA